MKNAASNNVHVLTGTTHACCFAIAPICAACSGVGFPWICAPSFASFRLLEPFIKPVVIPATANTAPIPKPMPVLEANHEEENQLELIPYNKKPAIIVAYTLVFITIEKRVRAIK